LVIYGLLFTELVQRVFGFKNHFVELIFDAVLSTLIVLVVGEFLPKAIFKGKNDSLLAFFAPVANFFYKTVHLFYIVLQ
jgi:CBS domain containing-hemolysin-like protein